MFMFISIFRDNPAAHMSAVLNINENTTAIFCLLLILALG